jgi:hypothetical protein
MKNFVKGSIIFASAFFLVACAASTRMVGTWNNKELTNNRFEKVAVLSVFPNTSNRYLTENAMVKNLKAENINATATYEIFPFAGKAGELLAKSENPEAIKERIKKNVEEQNIDAIIIITLLDQQKERLLFTNKSGLAFRL